MNLWKLSERAHRIARSKGFWRGTKELWEEHDPWGNADIDLINTKLLLIGSEVYEAMNEHRAADRATRYGAFADELADVIIRTADLAAHLGIDLEARVTAKMAVNEKREAMHGGKQF